MHIAQPSWMHPSRAPLCQSSVSLGFEVMTPPIANSPAISNRVAGRPRESVSSFVAAPGVALVANDTEVRTALCRFFNLTSGVSWTQRSGWCDPAAPVCSSPTQRGWFGLQCDPTGQHITGMMLSANGLKTTMPTDLSAVFVWTAQLVALDLSFNPGLFVSRLDLSTLHVLASLTLSSLPSSPPAVPPIVFPSSCGLTSIDVSSSGFDLSTIVRCSNLSQLTLSFATAPFQFALLASLPALTQFTATGALLAADGMGEYAGQAGVVTTLVLSRLSLTNPALTGLDLSSSSLPFGPSNATDNWPHLVSSSLWALFLASLPQLSTGPDGPADPFWLRDLPSLQSIDVGAASNFFLRTSDFAFAPSLQIIPANSVPLLGDLQPLCDLHALHTVDLTDSGLSSVLPQDISACWPQLEFMSVASWASLQLQ